jgi:hypothetical protein
MDIVEPGLHQNPSAAETTDAMMTVNDDLLPLNRFHFAGPLYQLR